MSVRWPVFRFLSYLEVALLLVKCVLPKPDMDSMDINDTELRRALAAAHGQENVSRICADPEFHVTVQQVVNLAAGLDTIIDHAEIVMSKLEPT